MTGELRESMASLLKAEMSLHGQRASIVNHCADASISGMAKLMPFAALEERYNAEEGEYRKILDSFRSLLRTTRSMLEESHSAVNRAEIVSNEACSVRLSAVEEEEVDSAAYSQAESVGSSNSRQFAPTMSTKSDNGVSVDPQSDDIDAPLGVPEPAMAMQHRESVVLAEAQSHPEPESKAHSEPEPEPESKAEAEAEPEAQSGAMAAPKGLTKEDFPALRGSGRSKRSLTVPTARVSRNVKVLEMRSSRKYSGKGFGIWKKHRGRAIRTATELYSAKVFAGNLSERQYVEKLKRFLASKGGFNGNQIRSVRAFQVPDRSKGRMVWNARIVVEGSLKSIEAGIERIDSERRDLEKNKVLYISKLRRNQRSNRLVVKNFDILTKDDHCKFTTMFSAFGPLNGDVVMKRNRDGINCAVMTFLHSDDAQRCERMQNDEQWRHWNRGSTLEFNGRELLIGYAEQTRNGRKW